MLEIKNVEVYDLFKSIVASGYAMTTEPYDYNMEIIENLQKHLNRAEKLVSASNKSNIKCHDNFLTGILVSFDVKYPQYISPELQRYHFLQIVTSQSKMHRLLRMDIDKACNKYVSQASIDVLKSDIELWNKINNDEVDGSMLTIELRNEKIIASTKEQALYHVWMKCISDCPMGLELWMRVTTNYKQLQTIYNQRKNHKLKEDWGAFCEFIESLPHSYLITGKNAEGNID